VLRRIFGPKREERAGGWRRLHNEERHNLYATPNVIRVVRSRKMDVACSTDGREKFTFIILVGNLEGKRSLGRSMRRWEDNIKMDLREIGWKGVDWIHLAQDRDQRRNLVYTLMNLPVV
jgi:hypothetical protein